MSTGEIVHRGLRYRVDAGKHVDFCRGFVSSTAERGRVTYFKSDKAYGRAAISQGDIGNLDSSVLGTVSKSAVPDPFRKSARQEKGGTFPSQYVRTNVRRLMVS